MEEMLPFQDCVNILQRSDHHSKIRHSLRYKAEQLFSIYGYDERDKQGRMTVHNLQRNHPAWA